MAGYTSLEILAIQQAYESMLKDIQPFINAPNQLELIDKAYRYCLDEYDGRYLLSGKAYMMHLIEMGRIAVLEVGLGYILWWPLSSMALTTKKVWVARN